MLGSVGMTEEEEEEVGGRTTSSYTATGAGGNSWYTHTHTTPIQ